MTEFKTCAGIKKYLLEKTGVNVEVTKTENYLVFNYAINGTLETKKIWCHTIYCFNRKELDDIIQRLQGVGREELYIVYHVNEYRHVFCGIFDSKEKAESICRDKCFCIFPVKINEDKSNRPNEEWPG